MNTVKNIIRGAGGITCVLVLAVQIGGCSGKCPCANKAIHRSDLKLKTDKVGAENRQNNEKVTDLSVTEK
jgi:hypothetical protein